MRFFFTLSMKAQVFLFCSCFPHRLIAVISFGTLFLNVQTTVSFAMVLHLPCLTSVILVLENERLPLVLVIAYLEAGLSSRRNGRGVASFFHDIEKYKKRFKPLILLDFYQICKSNVKNFAASILKFLQAAKREIQ